MSSNSIAGSQLGDCPAVGATQTSPEPNGSSEHSSRSRIIGVVATAVAISVLYLLFVLHYSMNVLYVDDWTVVPLLHAADHGHLTLSALWAQHNENRVLVPNLVIVGLGMLTRDNTKVVIALSACVFIATYAVLLATFRSYLSRSLTPLLVLVVGVVWFSIVDWQNALWAFQFAWYLILLFLVAMIYSLQRRWFAMAVVLAVLASFSSFQGLVLWPVGLVWLWMRNRRLGKDIPMWIAAAIATTVVYFWNYTHQDVLPIWRYPVYTAQFFLIELGEVVPRGNALRLHEVLGAVVLGSAVFVVIQSIRHDRDGLPVALIIFGLLFDIFITLGRVGAGLSAGATQSRYTMAGLVVLVGIVVYASAHLHRAWILALLALLVAQLAVATDSGLTSARMLDQHNTISARLVVNLDKIPAKERYCYAVVGVYVYVDPDSDKFQLIELATADRLSELSPGPFQKYRMEGLPGISACQ